MLVRAVERRGPLHKGGTLPALLKKSRTDHHRVSE